MANLNRRAFLTGAAASLALRAFAQNTGGTKPFRIDIHHHFGPEVWVSAVKGRPLLALIGVFLSPVSFVSSFRLASPTSMWARRRYKAGSSKLARSQARFARMHARNQRLLDLIGGRPSVEQAVAAISGPDEGREQ